MSLTSFFIGACLAAHATLVLRLGRATLPIGNAAFAEAAFALVLAAAAFFAALARAPRRTTAGTSAPAAERTDENSDRLRTSLCFFAWTQPLVLAVLSSSWDDLARAPHDGRWWLVWSWRLLLLPLPALPLWVRVRYLATGEMESDRRRLQEAWWGALLGIAAAVAVAHADPGRCGLALAGLATLGAWGAVALFRTPGGRLSAFSAAAVVTLLFALFAARPPFAPAADAIRGGEEIRFEGKTSQRAVLRSVDPPTRVPADDLRARPLVSRRSLRELLEEAGEDQLVVLPAQDALVLGRFLGSALSLLPFLCPDSPPEQHLWIDPHRPSLTLRLRPFTPAETTSWSALCWMLFGDESPRRPLPPAGDPVSGDRPFPLLGFHEEDALERLEERAGALTARLGLAPRPTSNAAPAKRLTPLFDRVLEALLALTGLAILLALVPLPWWWFRRRPTRGYAGLGLAALALGLACAAATPTLHFAWQERSSLFAREGVLLSGLLLGSLRAAPTALRVQWGRALFLIWATIGIARLLDSSFLAREVLVDGWALGAVTLLDFLLGWALGLLLVVSLAGLSKRGPGFAAWAVALFAVGAAAGSLLAPWAAAWMGFDSLRGTASAISLAAFGALLFTPAGTLPHRPA